MGEPKIINYIEVEGEDVLFGSLPEDERKSKAEEIQIRMMNVAGYRRKPA